MNRWQRDLYEATLESLAMHPEEWTGDDYRVEHPSGVSVWIANAHYGMEIRIKDKRALGGVTAVSSFFGPLIPWRRRLRAAAVAALPDQNNWLREAAANLRLGAAV